MNGCFVKSKFFLCLEIFITAVTDVNEVAVSSFEQVLGELVRTLALSGTPGSKALGCVRSF